MSFAKIMPPTTKTLPFLLVLALCAGTQQACIWKLWSKKPIEERTLDVYGTVETITGEELVITTRRGETQQFVMLDSSIKGSDFEEGAYVHVYYRLVEDRKEVTMVVGVIND
ncbi:MAG TPA: hypothetical protein VMN76_06495 [Acidobacteriota bacterium]|nr:hypothetical protein [Acidobacteriota bacterium]